MNNMDIYWRELSYENANLVGSTVVGWFNMPQARADYLDGPGGQLNHAEIAEDCTAAADAFVNFPDYLGINLMFNQDLDCCSWGGSSVLNRDGISRIYSITWMATWGWGNHNVMGHEMGHGFGLPHSSGPYTATYDSQWDVMSGGGTCSPPDPTFGCLGVHTIGFHKDALGWIPDSRRYMATTGPDQSIFIERLAQPGTSGYLVAQIPIGGSTTNFYTVEARKFVGFDQQVPGEAIVIHLVDTIRGDRLAQVVDVDSIPNSNPNDDGAMWLPGEVFTDTVNNIAIAIMEDTGSGYRIIINPTNRPPVADNQAVTTHQNIPQAITLTASDPDGDTITYSIVTNPSAGTLSSLNPPAGTVTYTPNTNYFGPDSFTFMATDSGGADSNTATVSIVVKGVPNCDGATIVGNDNRNDVLQGTSGDDVIAGLGGNDVIYGNGGHDMICGGNGNDYLDGGAGDDQVNGEAGNDRVSGREGNDELYGREGNDFLDSGAGNDFLIGESGNDFLDSGAGNDELYGREGNDFINGGPDNDIGDGGPNQDSCINVETRSNCEG
jgi:M6 family metalloprotease-like protein